MNSKVIIALIVVIVVLGGAFWWMKSYKTATPESEMNETPTTSTTTPVSGNTVTIQNFAFAPASITVKVGDSVTWTNQDSAGHSATADDGSFDTGVLSQGSSKAITFSKAGTYQYHCSVHPNMKGTVVVQ